MSLYQFQCIAPILTFFLIGALISFIHDHP